MKIRPMQPKDFGKVQNVWKTTPGVGFDKKGDSTASLKRYLKRNPGQSFVAVEGAEIAGTVLSGHDGRRGYIYHLAVREEYRKLGIANKLVRACLKGLKKEGIAKCTIFVFRSNKSGRAFWLHSGWNPREDLGVLQKQV